MFATLKKPNLLKIYFIPLFAMLTDAMAWSISISYAIELNSDILQINLITTISSTMFIIIEIPFGILSDRFGRKPMLVYTRATQIIGTLIRVFATQPNHLLIASFLGGFAGGDFYPVLLSMVTDLAEPEKRHEVISVLFIFSSIGMLVSPTVCSLLLLSPQITLRNIYQMVLVGQIAIVVYVVSQIQETKHKTTESKKIKYRTYLADLIRQKNFQTILIMSFLYYFSRSTLNTYLQIYAKIDLNLSNAEVASFSAYTNLAIMIIRFMSATILTKFPFRPTLISFLTLGGIASLSTFFAKNYASIVIIFFLMGISYGAVRIMDSILVANNSTPENRGVANSMHNASMSIANTMVIATSPIVETFGVVTLFIVGGLICLTSTIPQLMNKGDNKKAN